MRKPIQYVGGELNSTVGLARRRPLTPAVQSRSSAGPLMYPDDAYGDQRPQPGPDDPHEVLNERPDALAERTYAVWPDMEDALRSAGLPQFTVDGPRDPRLDVFGISCHRTLATRTS